ncbi:MAG: ABC transporter ATP-binding protein [Myxococcales bacterium]|nr:ABC transporter ATP-binding protein [Myxococcales bacterium]
MLRAFHEEDTLGKSYDWGLMKRLWPFVRPYRRLFFAAMAVVMLTAAGALAQPLVMRWAIDDGVASRDAGILMRGGVIVALIVITSQALSFFQIYTIQVVGARSMADLRRVIFQHLHKLKVGFFDVQPVGRLVTRVTNDVDAILELFASGALGAFGDLIRLVGIVVAMLILDWHLSLIAFLAVPPVVLMVRAVRKRSRSAYREIRAKTARMNATMNEQVNGMAIVQAYRREEAASREFDQINADYRDANIRSVKYEAIQDAAIEMVSAVCLASIILALGYRQSSFGTLVAFNAYLVMFFEPISALAQRYTLLQSAMAGAERVFGLLDVEEVDAAPASDVSDGDPKLAFELDRVDFEYKPGVPVLKQVSFSARPGEKIAVVGPTGAGKTTVASLLLRLYELKAGVVRVNGDDVRGISRDELRKRFAVVPQDVFLFQGTVASNIAAGLEPDIERVKATLRQIDALDLFERRKGGVLAEVDEHGANFSAGERQLIAFARALYRDTELLILDEATASVDSDTEARLQRALERLMAGRTALIIAHRLSTVRAADRIVVFHKGRVVEQGNHEELLALGGLYAKLYQLHFAGESERGGEQGAERSSEPSANGGERSLEPGASEAGGNGGAAGRARGGEGEHPVTSGDLSEVTEGCPDSSSVRM